MLAYALCTSNEYGWCSTVAFCGVVICRYNEQAYDQILFNVRK